jgi:hypothetical protein
MPFLWCEALWFLWEPTFRRVVSPPSSWWKISTWVFRLQVTAKVLSSPILFTLMMGAIFCSESSVLTRVRWDNIPEDGNLRNENCTEVLQCEEGRHKGSFFCSRRIINGLCFHLLRMLFVLHTVITFENVILIRVINSMADNCYNKQRIQPRDSL